jgi:pimeloyl-ACP methyl ester carboxylesterase
MRTRLSANVSGLRGTGMALQTIQAPTRRSLNKALAATAALMLPAACTVTAPRTRPAMNVAQFHAARRFANTPSGEIAYSEQGQGPVALFLHGVPLNGLHWRHVIAHLADARRCVALDLMGLGYTSIAAGRDLSFTAQAAMVREFIDAMGFDQVDLVANDSGGAVAQIFAAHHPGRLRTLTLTNCDVHDNWPPVAIAPAIEAARAGTLIDRYLALIDDAAARHARFTNAWVEPTVLTDEVYRAYIEPLAASAQRRDDFHRYWLAFDHRQTVAIEPQLRQLHVPTLVVWALDDIYFDVKWAHWLRDAIPGVVGLTTVAGARLFFPEDRPLELVQPLRSFWGL